MLTRLSQLLKRNKFIYFLGKIICRFFSKDFQNYVIQYRAPVLGPTVIQSEAEPSSPPYLVPNGVEDTPGHRVFHWEIHELGKKNFGKIVLYLANDAGHGGFCGLWIYYLNRLSFADRTGMAMCINTYHSKMYQEAKPYREARNNVFEYYFQQPAGISVDDALQSQSVIYDWNNPEFGFDDFFHVGGPGDYTYDEKDISYFAKINRKYIRIQPDVQQRLDKDMLSLIKPGMKVVGVHARGTDYKIGYKGHPVIVTGEMYIREAEKAAAEMKASKIFLATDDNEMLKLFKTHFGERLLYYKDVVRSEGSVWNCEFDQDRLHHRFLLGYEILRDTVTLGHCDGLICGLSYVGFMAQVLKKSDEKEYELMMCINSGLRETGVELTSSDARAEIHDMWEKEVKSGKGEDTL